MCEQPFLECRHQMAAGISNIQTGQEIFYSENVPIFWPTPNPTPLYLGLTLQRSGNNNATANYSTLQWIVPIIDGFVVCVVRTLSMPLYYQLHIIIIKRAIEWWPTLPAAALPAGWWSQLLPHKTFFSKTISLLRCATRLGADLHVSPPPHPHIASSVPKQWWMINLDRDWNGGDDGGRMNASGWQLGRECAFVVAGRWIAGAPGHRKMALPIVTRSVEPTIYG